MELKVKEDAAFRDELRTFRRRIYPTEMRRQSKRTDLTKEQSLLWHRILYKKAGSPRRERNMEARVGPSYSAIFRTGDFARRNASDTPFSVCR
jgi:hypothetical protein